MGLIKVKIKVKLISEEDLEWDSDSMGKVYKNPEWAWRFKVIDTQYIYELTEFTQNKTIMEMSDGKLFLVAEPIDKLYSLWGENKEKDLDLSEPYIEEQATEDEEDD